MTYNKRWLTRLTLVALVLIILCAFGLPLTEITIAWIGLLTPAWQPSIRRKWQSG